MAARVPATCRPIVTAEPYLAWAQCGSAVSPLAAASVAGVHPSAVVDATARVDPTAEIGPLAVIGARAKIGPFCRIGPGAVIGDRVQMGPHCRVGAHASISHAMLGARVYVYPGARIGQEGFGFAMGPAGFVTVPQLGRVVLEDDVEVGANSCDGPRLDAGHGDRRRVAPRQPGADRAQRPPRPLLHRGVAGRDFGVHRA